MAGIKTAITDILTKLATITVTNQMSQTVALHTRIWNNQIQLDKDGKLQHFPKPAAFVEVVNAPQWLQLGGGYITADLGIRIHLVHEFFNLEGTFEQDLTIFDLRDKLVGHFNKPTNGGLSGYCATGCSPLNLVGEEQEYDHDNLYHYILDFSCNFVDSKTSPYDTGAGEFIETANPNLDLAQTYIIKK